MEKLILRMGLAIAAIATGVVLAPESAQARKYWCDTSPHWSSGGWVTVCCSIYGPNGNVFCGWAYSPRLIGDGDFTDLRVETIESETMPDVLQPDGEADERSASFVTCYLNAVAEYCPEEVAEGVSGECAASINADVVREFCAQ